MKFTLLILSFLATSAYSLGIGSLCTLHKDCDSGVCSFTASTTGYCLKKCNISANPSECGKNSVCQTQVDASKDKADGCTITSKECSIDTDCKTSAAPICNQYSLQCEGLATATILTTINVNNDITTVIPLTTTKKMFNNWSKKPNSQNVCQDKVKGGFHDCNHLAIYCTNSVFKSMMIEKCPKTCGFCTDENGNNEINSTGTKKIGNNRKSCIDKLDSCYRYTGLCKSPAYKDFMKKYCQSTCGC